jgi:hypothetical protein
MRFNARLDASHHGPPHPSKDAGAVADSLTGIHSAMVKCQQELLTQEYLDVPTGKTLRIQIRRAWRPCSGSSSTYPPVMILGTSRTARLQCARAPSCMYRIRALTPVVHLPVPLADHVVVACKPMWQKI